ncbi:MAG TPA: glycosyltransferase family 9 protein [Chloroflexota bacterium]|nr:glycosyltransferase family 9 protein [Chloroflexota bacterium]
MLVLRPAALGDTLLALPALRALRRTYGSLTLAAQDGAARLLAAVGEVDRGIAFDDPTLAWVFRDAAPPDDEPIVAWLSGARPAALAHALVVTPGRPPGEDVHCARYLLETLPFGAPFDDRPLAVMPLTSDEVLVHPGSGSPTKNWPAEHFAWMIRALDGPVRLIVGEADHAAADALDAALGKPLSRLQHLSLVELAARLAGCRAYVGNDSGISHLAGLSGARTVALFGPTRPSVWSPLGPRVKVVPFETDPADVAKLLAA